MDKMNPTTHEQSIRLRHALNSLFEPLNPKLNEVIESEFSSILPKDTDLSQYNSDYLSKNSNSAAHVQASICARNFLELESHLENQKDILRTLALGSVSQKDAVRGLELLNAWQADQRICDDYIAAAHERWPHAGTFEKKGT